MKQELAAEGQINFALAQPAGVALVSKPSKSGLCAWKKVPAIIPPLTTC